MYRTIFYLSSVFLAVLIPGFTHAQWTKSELPIPSNIIIYDIDFASENKGWAVGTDGHILFFDGNSWEVDTVIVGNDFSRVEFTTENEGWAVTVSGRIFRYDGNQWNLDFTATGGKGLFTLYFLDPNEGFVSGADGYLAYYNGVEWIEGDIGFNEFTLTSYFSDNKNGWLSAGAGKLYQFKDSVWSSVTIPSSGSFNAMTFTAPDNGYGTGFSKDIWHYNGTDWMVDYTGENDQFTSLFFLDENQGWAGGKGYIATYNYGLWTEETVDTDWIFDIYFTDPNHGWAMGQGGFLLTYTSPYASLSWRLLDYFQSELHIADFSSNSSGEIYAAGHTQDPMNRASGLFRSTDGFNWNQINSDFNNYILVNALYASDNFLLASLFDSDGFSSLLKSSDNGLSWNPAQNGIGANSAIEYIASDNSGVLYAVAYHVDSNNFSPELYKSSDGAETWELVNVTGFPTLTNATFNNINYTGMGFLLTFIDLNTNMSDLYMSADGTAWSKLESEPSGFQALDVAIGEDDTWYLSGVDATTLEGELYSSVNQGASWQPIDTTGLGQYNHLLVAIHSFGDQLFLSNSDESSDNFAVFTTSARQEQVITFGPLTATTYGQAPFTLSASASSGLPLTFSSSNTAVATVEDDQVTILGAGTTMIQASQAGNDAFFAAEAVEQLLTVEKAMLTATANDATRAVGDPNPSFTLAYDGFVNEEDVAVIDVLPQATTNADVVSMPGSYEITVSGGMDNNYAFSYVSGTLTVVEPMITSLESPLNNAIKVYPNPASGTIHIETVPTLPEHGTIRVFNMTGKEVISGQLEDRKAYNLGTYPPGVYWLKIVQDQKVHVLAVLKE